MTAWEHSLRVPLIISVPWLSAAHGAVHAGMAEMCGFYLTLSDLAGLPRSTVDPGVECDSLATAVSSPGGAAAAGQPHAFSRATLGAPSHAYLDYA